MKGGHLRPATRPGRRVEGSPELGGAGSAISFSFLAAISKQAAVEVTPVEALLDFVRLGIFGSLAIVVRGKRALDPVLCAYAFRRICRCHNAYLVFRPALMRLARP